MLDTNIVLYLLSGDINLAALLDNAQIYLSFISELELQFKLDLDENEKQIIRNFLDSCNIVDINEDIKKLTLSIRKSNTLKLPDCIIAATAKYLDVPVMTADKYFSKIESVDVIIYDVETDH